MKKEEARVKREAAKAKKNVVVKKEISSAGVLAIESGSNFM